MFQIPTFARMSDRNYDRPMFQTVPKLKSRSQNRMAVDGLRLKFGAATVLFALPLPRFETGSYCCQKRRNLEAKGDNQPRFLQLNLSLQK